MKIKLRTTVANAQFAASAGTVIDLPEADALPLVEAGYAYPIGASAGVTAANALTEAGRLRAEIDALREENDALRRRLGELHELQSAPIEDATSPPQRRQGRRRGQ